MFINLAAISQIHQLYMYTNHDIVYYILSYTLFHSFVIFSTLIPSSVSG